MSAEELAKRLDSQEAKWLAMYGEIHSKLMLEAAAFIRTQSARIAELERRQIKVRWEGDLAYVGVYPMGRIGLRPNGKWGTSNIRSGEIGEAATESEARAAVEAAAVKMMGGE